MFPIITKMRFEVPQFIEVEDKIFGPVTAKQFVFLTGGVGMAVVLFITTNFFIFLLFGLPLGALAILFAFYKVNNRPFSHFAESFIQYTGRNKLYLWRKTGGGIYHGQPRATGEAKSVENYIPQQGGSNLHSLSRKLELKAMEKQT